MESSYSFGNQQRPSTSERSRKILVYEPVSRDRPWRYLETQLSVQRSSCQAVLIQDRDDDSNYGILISGGLGPNGEVLRST